MFLRATVRDIEIRSSCLTRKFIGLKLAATDKEKMRHPYRFNTLKKRRFRKYNLYFNSICSDSVEQVTRAQLNTQLPRA